MVSRIKQTQLRVAGIILAVLCLLTPAVAQTPVLWEPVNISKQDLYLGPGGEAMTPDLSRVTFIKKVTGGTQKKYQIRDGSGRIWVAKLGSETRPETAAVRLLYGLGYKTEINYLVPRLTIPGKGTFQNVRLEARPENVKRVGVWKWKSNPFVGKPELQALKIMQAFITNWDATDKQNEILRVNGEDRYIISDLGSSFGKYGNNNLPIFYRLGRRTGAPGPYSRARFVKGREDGRIQFAVKGRSRGMFKDISMRDASWLLTHLRKLNDRQIEDAFRAANYSPAEVELYRKSVKRRIAELEDLTGGRLAAR